MTIWYPDISSYQAGISLKGTVACCCKATEGTTYFNPDYNRAKNDAAAHGVYFFAYHFLAGGNSTAQAIYCHSKVGSTPVMVDVEAGGADVPTTVAFVKQIRQLGGKCGLIYLPHWYWQQIGSPSLKPLADLGCKLTASAYTTYSDTSPNWNGYGGMQVAVWQYTDSFSFNGHSVDFNAFRGTVAGLQAAASGAAPPPSGGSALTPAVAFWQNRRFEFGLAPYGHSPRSVYYRSFTKVAGAWKRDQKDWTDIGGEAAAGSGVSAAISDEGEVAVVVIGTDGAMWHNSQPPNGKFDPKGWASDGGKFA